VLCALAAMPRVQLRRVLLNLMLFASALEASHLLAGAAFRPLLRNWVADLGGISAAAAPILVARYRRRIPPRDGRA
jgi:hypothetical protein